MNRTLIATLVLGMFTGTDVAAETPQSTTLSPSKVDVKSAESLKKNGSKKSVEQRVKKIVATQLGVNETLIKNESLFVKELGADSLDTVELVLAVEDEFGIAIPDEEVEKLTSVQLVIDFVLAYQK